MRLSCNGCRVLRRGCSENCSIRPCLHWIKDPESQANATVFLAKFYGRAGLMNLINSGPEHLRPATFRSLLYEACGRIVNPVYGSVGLLWSGSWELCQGAVEAVLTGAPITQIRSEAATAPLKAYDIRHLSKEDKPGGQDLLKVKTRSRFKGSAAKPRGKRECAAEEAVAVQDGRESPAACDFRWRRCYPNDFERAASHESEPNGDSRESEGMLSVETEEASLVARGTEAAKSQEVELELELTLSFDPRPATGSPAIIGPGADTDKMEMGLDSPA